MVTSKAILIFLLLFFVLTGCKETPPHSNYQNQPDQKFCWDGVIYYFESYGVYQGGLAPAYNQDGTLKLCNQQEETNNGNN